MGTIGVVSCVTFIDHSIDFASQKLKFPIIFQVQFSDFPKGNHGDFLTLATLTTEPPQLCHGAGNSIDASHDQAAIKALEILTELGLDNVKPKKNPDDKKPKPILSNGLKK